MIIDGFSGWFVDGSFHAFIKCEHCGTFDRIDGNNSYEFWYKILPNIKCRKCNKKADENYVGTNEYFKFLDYSNIVPHMLSTPNFEDCKYAR
jgi:hypothetical protein